MKILKALLMAVVLVAALAVESFSQTTVSTNLLPSALKANVVVFSRDAVTVSATDSTMFLTVPYKFSILGLQSIAFRADTGSASPSAIVSFGSGNGTMLVADTLLKAGTVVTSKPTSGVTGQCAAGTYKLYIKTGTGDTTTYLRSYLYIVQ